MTEINNEKLIDFIDGIASEGIDELAEAFGDDILLDAIDNDEFDTDNIFEYVFNTANGSAEFSSRLSEIMKVNDDINKAIDLICEATNILTEYNRRFDNSADDAIGAFFDNTTHHPKRMFIELIEDSLR